MSNVPKILIVASAVLIVIGLLWMFLGRFVQLGRLPGIFRSNAAIFGSTSRS